MSLNIITVINRQITVTTMKKIHTNCFLALFVLAGTFSVWGQYDKEPTTLGADIMFTVFEATGGGPKMVLLLQKKDGTEVSVEEFTRFSYQDKPGVPPGFKELKLDPGNYTFDNFFQSADVEYHGRYSHGRFTLFFHPTTVFLDVKDGQIIRKTWYQFAETDLKIDCEEYYDNGEISAKGLVNKDGTKTGAWELYNKEGQLSMSGSFKNDQRVGVWKAYNESGKVTNELDFNTKTDTSPFGN